MSAPYSVTKHGVVALSESLHVTLQARNALVKVSVLCPGLVRTNIVECERNRPADLKNPPVELSPRLRAGLDMFKAAVSAAMPTQQEAEIVFDAIRNERFYIITDPAWMEVVKMRVDDLLRLENPRSPAAILMKIIKPAN